MRRVVQAIVFVLSVELATWGVALATGGTSVAVQQLTPKPGQEITVKGESLGANSQVDVVLTGSGRRVDLGTVAADGTGDFTATFTLPADLPPGTYQLQATGTERATTQLTVVGGSASGGSPAAGMSAAPVLRKRPRAQRIGLVAGFVIVAGVGLGFARWRRGGATVAR